MKIDGNIITFKSTPKYFDIEESGVKNNTVRVLTDEENMKIISFIEKNVNNPIYINIINSHTGKEFYRLIKNICDLKDPNLDHIITIITWDEGTWDYHELNYCSHNEEIQ